MLNQPILPHLEQTRYRDIVTFVDDDTRTLTSRQLQADGSWKQIAFAEYRHKKQGEN